MYCFLDNHKTINLLICNQKITNRTISARVYENLQLKHIFQLNSYQIHRNEVELF